MSPRLRSLPGFDTAHGFYTRDRRVAGAVLSAGVAFRLFLTMLPLSFLLAALLGFMKPSGEGSPADLASRAGLTANLAKTMTQAASQPQGDRWLLLILGVVLLLWAGHGVERALRLVHLLAWGLPPARDPSRVLSPLIVTAGILLLFIFNLIPNAVRIVNPSLVLPTRLALLVVYTGLWLLISWHLPHPPVKWTALLPGAILFGVGAELLQLIIGYFLAGRLAKATALYGALGVVSVTLISLVLAGRLILATAHLNATLWSRPQPA